MPKVSVIVPVYNVEKYIGRCIESIQEQTLTDWELILVDDCSPDNSIDIIQEYANKDSRIIVKRHEVNLGPMTARRWGDELACGDYITYCDGDDILPTDALESLYNTAIITEADMVSGDYIYITVDGSQSVCHNKLKYGNDRSSVFKSLLRFELQQSLWGKLFRASILKDYPYKTYDHFTNGEDGFLLYQIVQNITNIVQIDKPVYYYMQNMQSSSQKRFSENAIKNICMTNNFFQEIICKYPELNKDLEVRITRTLCSLYAQGYDKDARLNYFISENGLSGYLTFSSIIKNCKIRTLAHMYLRRMYNCWFKLKR